MAVLRACVRCGKPSPDSYCSEHRPKPWATSRRAERVGISGGRWQALRDQVVTRDRGCCYLCGRLVEGPFEIDHLVPVAAGGTNDLRYLATAHPDCHARRHREPDWAAERVESALRVLGGVAPTPDSPAAERIAAVARRGRAEGSDLRHG